MNKSRGIIILAIIIAVQFLVPFGALEIQQYQIKKFDEEAQEVKFFVSSVEYCDSEVVCVYDESSYDDWLYYFDEDYRSYIEFTESHDGYYECSTSEEKPKSDLYLKKTSDFNLGHIVYPVDDYFYDYYYDLLYDKENERLNIENGLYEGPETEAYITLKIHNGNCKVTGVYVDGVSVEELLEKAENGEINFDRYDYNAYDSYEDYDGNLDESLTETVEEDE
ncbi:MAG: hypothetical protein ACI4IF_04325 [Acutalibacteraceae bacterium]